MDLFKHDNTFNLLPYGGEVNYFGCVLPHSKNQYYLQYLLNKIKWQSDRVVIYGKHITTKRKVAWYGDKNYAYSYSNTTKYALKWTAELFELKKIVERLTHTRYNSCLLNLYHNGEEAMAWHSDNEKALEKNAAIASLSFGAERKFALKHKNNTTKISLTLEQGSLLVMKAQTQKNWLHCVPKMRNITQPRINLTFRKITCC